ncbi:hypothetical protein BTN49_0873 [Candidatus Enterovibrio escicola]|uniref:Uncharacterized protein n=1 Tax=Candidatus Enterovibrio escicola TaxID=1927127 RepID=A0A2A5T6W6_9GAMM|nr:hypothetical protein BTN49_0873 [Candidatus Enterovibrio escacola]
MRAETLINEPLRSLGYGCQDILHAGCLPRTICATPLFYALMGIDNDALKWLRKYETERHYKKT